MVYYHGNGKFVNLLEQLTELSKAQAMPGIRPQIKMSLRADVKDAEQEQHGEKGEGSFLL